MLGRVADVLRALLLETPPNVGGGVAEWLRAWKVGGRLRRLTLPERRDVLDLFTKSAGDLLDRWFESEPIKAAFGFDAVVGNFASPYTPGSAYVLLHHVFGEVNGKRGQWGHAMGGMGAITQAMASEAQVRGVAIFTDSPVARVTTRGMRATGIALADGAEITAPRVVANVDPASLFCQHANPQLAGGRSWDDVKDEVSELMLDTVNRYAPGFRASVIALRALSPLDLEREFGLTGGDIFHGQLTLDQLFSARPVLGHGNYRGPLKGLNMCGAGTHPGGGVTGVPGLNAAREILRDARRRRM